MWLALPHKSKPPTTATVGLDVALEALRAYWARDDRDPNALRRYARIDGIDKVLQPYLEAGAA